MTITPRISPGRIASILALERGASEPQVDHRLTVLGWTRGPRSSTAGSSRAISWDWRGGRPRVRCTTQTTEAGESLLLLDLGEVPPQMRARIAAVLPPADPSKLLASTTATDLVRGLAIVRETDLIEQIGRVTALVSHAELVVRTAASTTLAALTRSTEARRATLATLVGLEETVRPMLEGLRGSDALTILRDLRPDQAAAAKVFASEMSDAVAAEYDRLWRRLPRVSTDHPILEIASAPAGLLRSHNELSRRFPGGYRAAAGWLEPSRVWFAWRFRDTEGPGVAYDGLVWTGSRWAWFPKPFRVLGGLLSTHLAPGETGAAGA